MTMNCFSLFCLVLFVAKVRRQEGKYETRWLQFVDILVLIGFRLIFRKVARAILDDYPPLLIKLRFFFFFLPYRQTFLT